MAASCQRLLTRQTPQRPEHGAVTGKTADEVADRLGKEDACHAEPADLRQDDGQRHDDDDFAEERKERRLFALAEADKGALPDRLEGHEEEAKEKDVHQGTSR